MSNHPTHSPQASVFRRMWKPAFVTGAGGATLAFWFDQIVMFGEEFLALVFLPILAGVIYLYDILLFRSQTPRCEDMKKPDNKGVIK
jgi:hypothetical protein